LFPYLAKASSDSDSESDQEGDEEPFGLEGDPFSGLVLERPGLRSPALQKAAPGSTSVGKKVVKVQPLTPEANVNGLNEDLVSGESEDVDVVGDGFFGGDILSNGHLPGPTSGGGDTKDECQRGGQDAEAAALAVAAEMQAAGGEKDAASRRNMFQAAMLQRVQRGQLQSGGRVQQGWDRDSWPRCGWWVRSLGAFAVPGTSECPVLTPYQPLGEFIEEVGRQQTEEEVSSYINRLKERGWELGPGILSRLTGNAQASKESMEIVRLPGLVSDKDMVGDIVWAKDLGAGIYWPGEVLDPLDMPSIRELPADAEAQLSWEQRRASIPCKDGSYDPKNESARNRRVVVKYFPLSSGMWAVSCTLVIVRSTAFFSS